MSSDQPSSTSKLPQYLLISLFVLVTLVFLIVFVTTTETEMNVAVQSSALSTPVDYETRVVELLKDANSEHGAQLVEQYGCIACHRDGVQNKIAPAFVGIGERAASRRPPLTAAAYIYESITNPLAYIVEGFNPAMPQNFAQRLSDRELGDIMAFLLSSNAH
ncbi:MAG: c-type cytochrome [Anaerolineae bacterium]